MNHQERGDSRESNGGGINGVNHGTILSSGTFRTKKTSWGCLTALGRKRLPSLSFVLGVVCVVQQAMLYSQQLTRYSLPVEEEENRVEEEKSRPPLPVDHSSSSLYDMAYRESLGFFDDVPEELWLRRKNITNGHVHIFDPHNPDYWQSQQWFQMNWEPDFACFFEERVGGNQDGHKWVCDPHRIRKNKDCLVYSIGSNGNFLFERALQVSLPNCDLHVFDPEPTYVNNMTGVAASYHAWGIRSLNGASIRENGLFKTLNETMHDLGHTGRRVDLFKIDCEGCEWRIFREILEFDLRQILVEVHPVFPKQPRYPRRRNAMFQAFHDAGYVIFHKEPNIMGCSGNCVEFSLLKLDKNILDNNKNRRRAN